MGKGFLSRHLSIKRITTQLFANGLFPCRDWEHKIYIPVRYDSVLCNSVIECAPNVKLNFAKSESRLFFLLHDIPIKTGNDYCSN